MPILPTAASVPFAAVATDDGDAASTANLDGDVKLLLKKMTKKDTITKCKALSEFVSMLDEDSGVDDENSKNETGEEGEEGSSASSVSQKKMSPDDIKALIPFWPRLYNALSMDSDRKVRELTQQAMLQLVKPERKKLLAPHLKTFLGAWMMALVDSYPPASSAATRAFDAAFTKPKQVEAVRFCRKEIFLYLKDILLDQNPTTLSDPKATPKDEMDAKYERVVAASLSALKMLVEMTAEDDGAAAATSSTSSAAKTSFSLDTELESLLSSKKMVKLSVHSNPMIRTSWFSVVATVSAACPKLFANDGSSKLAAPLASSVLNRFEETDPTVVGAFWNAVMAILKVVPDPWSHASLRKSILPKLFLLLRSGCGGNAVVVGPNLVVLISKMPTDVVGIRDGHVDANEGDSDSSPALKFYKELSSAVMESLDKGAKTFQSASESAALILCLAECLQFLLISPGNVDGDDADAARRIPLMREFASLLETALRHKNSKHNLSYRFFRVLENVLDRAKKEDFSCQIFDLGTESEQNLPLENQLEQTFWSALKNSIESWVDGGGLEMVEKLSGVLRNVNQCASAEVTSKRNVGFDCDDARNKLPAPKTDPQSPFKRRMLDELKMTLYSLLGKSPSSRHLRYLRSTCDEVVNDRFLQRVLDQRQNTEVHTLSHFESVYDNVWLPLRRKFDENDLNSDVRMDFAFLLTSWVFDWEREVTPDFIDAVVKKVNDPLLLLTIVVRSRSPPREKALPPGWSAWLESPTFSDYALEAVQVVINGRRADPLKEDKDSFLTEALEHGYIDPLVISKMAAALADALDEVWASNTGQGAEGKWNVSTILKYVSLIFRHNWRWNLDSISRDGRNISGLHLLIWRECSTTLFQDDPSETFELEDHLMTCNDHALMAFSAFQVEFGAEEYAAEHAAALGDALRERIQAVGVDAVSRAEDEIVAFVSKTCSYLKGYQSWRNVSIFLQRIFYRDSASHYDAVSRQLWLPKSIMENSVYLDSLYKAQIETRNPDDGSSTSVYLQRISMFARVLDEVGLKLSAIPPTVDSEKMLILFAEIVFASELIDSNLFKCKGQSNSYRFLSQAVDAIIDQIQPTSSDKVVGSRTMLLSDTSNILMNYLKREGDDIGTRYERLCSLSLVALLKGPSLEMNLGKLYLFLCETDDLMPEMKETCLSLALENSLESGLELQRIIFEQLRSSLKASGEPSLESALFRSVSSLLFGYQHLSEKIASSKSVDRTVQLINDLVQAKPAVIVDNVAECADLSTLSWPVIQYNVNLMKMLTIFVDRETYIFKTDEGKEKQSRLALLTPKSWDFIFCSVLGWIQSVSESIDLLDSPEEESQTSLKVLSFAKACCDLVAVLSRAFCLGCCPRETVETTESWLTLSSMGQTNAKDATSAWHAGKLKAPARDWRESFCEPVYAVLLSAFVKFADATVDSPSRSTVSPTAFASVAESFRSVLECCTPDIVLLSEDVEIEAKLLVDDFAMWKAASSHLQSLFNRLASHLVNPFVEIQLLAYHLLIRLMPSVAKSAEDDFAKEYARRYREAENVSEDHSSSEEGWRPPASLVNLLNSSQTAFDILVEGMSVGETLHIEEEDDARSYVLAYVLVWNALRRLLNGASPELRAQYTVSLREEISKVLRHLLFLLPDCLAMESGRSAGSGSANPSRVAAVARLPLGAIVEVESKEEVSFILGNQDPILPPRCHASPSISNDLGANFYVSKPLRRVSPGSAGKSDGATKSASASLRSLHGLAGATFIGSFRDLPASVRQWWTDADKKTTAFVERISSVHISPVLSARELNSVEDDQSKSSSSTSALRDIIVKVRPQSREVVAIYTMDEITMELLIKVPPNFPLGQIAVECGKSLGEAKEQKRWMLQLTTFLRHQNGSIVDGIAMWKKNIDKPFEGVDPCMVCFSVLHSSNYQLPKLTCKACKKKFHSVCLYKWFSTSNNSSCPLCRSLF